MWAVGIIMYMLVSGQHPIWKEGEEITITEYMEKLKHPIWHFSERFSPY